MATTKKSIKGTQTEKNLVNAYMSESSAYTRYTFYAKQATKEDYFPIAQIFTETAENELQHSKVFFKLLKGGSVNCELAVDAGVIADTATNLATAIREEEAEGVKQYTDAAEIADKEGFSEIAEHFRAIAAVESHHRDRFQLYLDQVENKTVWKRDKPIKWKCLVCGYVHEGKEPPEICPACDHPREHYTALDICDE